MERSESKSSPLIALSDICKKHPRDEKIFIVPDYQAGHQILEGLTRAGTSWVNFRLATVSSLAGELSEEGIIREKLEALSFPGILAIIDDIFTKLADSRQLKYFEKHAVNKGIIEALTSTVTELRLRGVSSGTLKSDAFISRQKAADIKLILSEYEKILREKKLIDKAGLVLMALECVKGKSAETARKFVILSRCYMNGLERKFIQELAGDNLIVIDEGPVMGLEAPRDIWRGEEQKEMPESKTDIGRLKWLFKSSKAPRPFHDGTVDMFSAVGCRNEIREVFRRIASADVPVDEVEIVYTDSGVYGAEIYSLCEKLDIPVTFSEGTPGYLRSAGRAITGFLMWIKHDFTETYLRRLLESDDLMIGESSGGNVPGGAALAHLLRTSGVGWGRERYPLVLEKKIKEYEERAAKARSQNEGEKAAAYERNAGNIKTLKKLCKDLLELIPVKTEEGDLDFRTLCEGCAKFVKNYARKRDAMDSVFAGEAEHRFQMMVELANDKMLFDEALEKLINVVSVIKTGPSGPRPGHLHVSHYKHGGRTTRSNTFIVGLDEARFPGRGLQDPILLDKERKAVSDDLELSEERVRKNLYDMASLLAVLRGRVTVSFSAYDVKEERGVFPSSILLQILRVKEGSPGADYADLFKALGDPVTCSAGSKGEINLDGTDWWLARLAETEVLKDAKDSIKGIYPWINRGIEAREARGSDQVTAYDGKIDPEGDELDPRKNENMVMSCSRLEAAAKCPFKYFLESILKVDKPEEVTKELNVWLDPMERGSLLHEVFQKFAEKIKTAKKESGISEQRTAALKILDEVVKRYKDDIPPPSEVVFRNEYTQLKRDMDIFLGINEQLKTDPVHLEMKFGMGDKPPVEISLGNKDKIFLKGMIDRIDKAGGHEYHVWDYKTGSAFRYEQRDYVRKGEQLQHGLYSVAAEKILRDSGEDTGARVTKCGYILPTEKGTRDGKGGVFGRDPGKKEDWQAALSTLLDLIAGGIFIAPDKAECRFCNYAGICGDDKTRKQFKNKLDNEENKVLDAWRTLKQYE